ncbi:MAG: hypothetical protein AAF649_13110, partial [Verrucomicrobiota bacterium]
MVVFSLHGFPGRGQEETRQQLYTAVIPPSPTAAALGKYGAYQVNGSSGVPAITVPLFEIPGTAMAVPVSLSYHGSGNKVNAIASWVGLNWSLNAGGVITRTVVGKQDESGTGLFALYDAGFEADGFDPRVDEEDYHHFRAVAKGGWSADPDRYTFNVMGLSGQFYVGPDRDIHLYSAQNVKIYRVAGTGFIDRFILEDGQGVRYEFAEKETTSVSTSSDCAVRESSESYVSSWYLSKLTYQGDTFYFAYDSARISYDLTTALT